MNVSVVLTDNRAVSSAISVVLMVAVTVILAAAVGAFALDLAGKSTKETPSASVEAQWGMESGDDLVELTILGGDTVKQKYVKVTLDGTTIWNEAGTNGPYAIYNGQTWSSPEIESGKTLALKETTPSGFQTDDTVKVIWNNGEKSQVLGTGTLT